MSNFIEIKNGDNSVVINLQQVVAFYPSFEFANPNKISDKKIYYVAFRLNTKENDEIKKYCSSDLEALMIYAKLKKKFCIEDEELNEIL